MSGQPNGPFSEALHHNESVQRSGETEEITLGFGKNFSISCSCVYSAATGIEVESFMVSRVHGGQCEALFDLNADGITDSRLLTNRHLATERKPPMDKLEIWLGGKWREAIATGKKYQKRLPGGETVRFDLKRGCWVVNDE
jgi:hypothetical protein